jgi:hypothetical protein
MNALAVFDQTAQPTADLTRAIKAVGAEMFHKHWTEAMKSAGWRCGGSATNHELLMTPHLRRWSLLVDGQRKPLIAAGERELVASWREDENE